MADFNGDGFLDIINENHLSSGNIVDENPSLYLNQGNGSFTRIRLGRSAIPGGIDARGAEVAALGYNGDGFVDLALGRYDIPTRSYLLKNNGGGFFSAITNTAWTPQSQSYESISSVDYNGDGLPDLLGMGVSRPFAFRNNGGENFVRDTSSLLYNFQVGYATLNDDWGDYDNDGDPHGAAGWDNRPAPVKERDDLFVAEANAFLDGMAGAQTDLSTLDEALQTLRFNLAALESWRTGKPLEIKVGS